jgi:hypothetical protein
MIDHDSTPSTPDPTSGSSSRSRMTDTEQMLALMGGSFLLMWALRHGRIIPSIALALSGPLLVSGMRRRWPSALIERLGKSQSDRARLGHGGV